MQLDLFAPDPGADAAQTDEVPTASRDAGRPPVRDVTDARAVELVPVAPDDAGSPPLSGPADAGMHLPSVDAGAATAVKLILRYDFSGTGMELVDSVSARPAYAIGGAKLDGSGQLELDGIDDYVDLPQGTLASLDSVTVVTWLVLHEGGCRQPVFNFGETKRGPDADEDAEHAALSVLLSSCPAGDAGSGPPPASLVTGSVAIAHDRTFQLALSYDAERAQKTLYVNGVRISEGPVLYALSELGERAWLGRVRWQQDYFTRGSYDEFRVYDGVLTGSEIVRMNARGPNRP